MITDPRPNSPAAAQCFNPSSSAARVFVWSSGPGVRQQPTGGGDRATRRSTQAPSGRTWRGRRAMCSAAHTPRGDAALSPTRRTRRSTTPKRRTCRPASAPLPTPRRALHADHGSALTAPTHHCRPAARTPVSPKATSTAQFCSPSGGAQRPAPSAARGSARHADGQLHRFGVVVLPDVRTSGMCRRCATDAYW